MVKLRKVLHLNEMENVFNSRSLGLTRNAWIKRQRNK